MFLALICSVTYNSVIYANPTNQNVTSDVYNATKVLNQEEVNQKLNEINSKYNVGERFSDEDAQFIKQYALPVENNAVSENTNGLTTQNLRTTTWDINGSNSSLGYQTIGTVTFNEGVINHTVSVNMTTKDVNKKYHSEIGNQLIGTAYGVVGSDGVGIIANISLSDKGDNISYHKLVDYRSFSGVVAYMSFQANGWIKSNNGKITITPTLTRR